jgi:hypothetical protein
MNVGERHQGDAVDFVEEALADGVSSLFYSKLYLPAMPLKLLTQTFFRHETLPG